MERNLPPTVRARRDILKELVDFVKKQPRGLRDDIMRMLEILALTEEWT